MNGWQTQGAMRALIVPGWNGDMTRPIRLGVPYYLPMSIALTGVAGEQITGQTTSSYNDDLLVHAGITDLQTSSVQFALPGSLPQLWSQSSVSVRALFGAVDSGRPFLRYPYPLPLPVGRFISASVLNNNGEGAGTFVFLCSQPSDMPRAYGNSPVRGVTGNKDGGALLDPQRLGPMQIISVSSQFTGTASEQKNSDGILNPVDYDFLLLGMASDLALAKVQIIDCERRQWMQPLTVGGSNLCPIWAIAGRPQSSLWVQYLPLPYLIPANRMPSFNFQNDATNPEASGSVYMFGQRLLD